MYAQILKQEINMITYQDLCDGLIDIQDSASENKDELIKSIQKVVNRVGADLDILDRTWKDNQGQPREYLSILDLSDPKQPKPTNAHLLKFDYKGREVSCTFGIQIVLERTPSMYPKIPCYVPLTAKTDKGDILITIRDQDFNVAGNNPLNVESVSECVKSEVLNMLKQ